MAASFGAIYTAGYTAGALGGSASAGGFDLFLSKHDAAGNLLWKHQSGTVANDYVTGMAIHDADSSAVSVYVTGHTLGGLDGNTHAGGQDLFLVKYDVEGVKQWTRQLGSELNDFAQAVATDEVGNVYLTGCTFGGLDENARAGGQDLFLVKYDAEGVKQWTRQLGTKADEQARGVAADAEGNVYVTGFTSGGLDGNASAGTQDLFLVKYDAAGVKQWTRQLGTSGRDVAQAVATSRRATGELEVYVVGRSEGGAGGIGLDGGRQRGSYDIVVAKYDVRGMRQWVRQTGTSGEDSASGVTSDGAGNVYVVGSVPVDLVSGASLGSNDLVLLKYDAGGTLLVSRQLGSVNAAEPTRASDWGQGVAVDRGRGVYVAGYVEGGFNGETNAGSKDLLLAKYPEGCEANAPGQCARGYGWGAESRWSRQLGTSGDDYSDGVSVSCDGSIYTAGHVAGGLEGLEHAGGLDLFVVKYSPGGTRLWARQLGTPGDEVVLGSSSDASGAVYVVGTTSGGLDGHTSAGDFDLFLVKYDAAGARLWTRQLGSRDYDQASSVTTDAAGNVYVAGVTYGDLDGNINQGGFEGDMFLVKYTADGHKKWTRQFGTMLLDQADGVAVDGVGNVYVAGITHGVFPGTSGLGDQDLVVAKFSAEGERLWARQLGTSEYDSLGGVATDPNGVVYLSASTYGLLKGQAPAGGVDVLLFKVGSAGDVLWARQLGTEGDDNAAGVATDIAGNLYVTGSTAGAWAGHTNAGELDMMVLKVSPDGTRQWARQIGTPLGEHAEDLAVDARGNVTLGGATFGAFAGGKELGGLDVVVLRYGLVECGNQCGSGCP